jgi:AraC-like DNA-binding protein
MQTAEGAIVRSFALDLSRLPESDREAAWRKASGPHFELQDLPRRMEARGRAWDLGPVVLTDTLHPRQTFVRDIARARRDGVDHLLVSVELTEGFKCETPRGQELVSPHRVTVFDVARPSMKVASAGRTICMAVSRDLMDEVLPGIDLHGLTLGPSGALMAEHLRSLSAFLPQTPAKAAPHLARATVHMLAACVLPSAERLEAARPALSEALLQRAKRYIRANCQDPGLTPETVAAEIGASRTSLYRAFQSEGGVSEFIRATRLDAARAALVDPADRRRIGEIAFAYGFGSEAHFSRAIRNAFGVSPGELRREPHDLRSGLSPENWARRGWRDESSPVRSVAPATSDGARVLPWRPGAAAASARQWEGGRRATA